MSLCDKCEVIREGMVIEVEERAGLGCCVECGRVVVNGLGAVAKEPDRKTHCEHRHGANDAVLLRICGPGFGLSASISPKVLANVMAALTADAQ